MKIQLLLLLLLITGCAQLIPTKEERAAADYGAYPDNYRQLVSDFINSSFYDPHSVQDLEVNPPVKELGGDMSANKWHYGYRVSFFCNAKNQYGGYTGKKWFHIFVRDGQVLNYRTYLEITGKTLD